MKRWVYVKNAMILSLLCLLHTVLAINDDVGAPKKSSFRGFEKQEFTIAGRQAFVILPKKVLNTKPWLWRARFPNYANATDMKLLEQGYHVAYVDVAGLFGSPKAIAIWDRFYSHMTTTYGVSSKPVLKGVSRGGLPVYNWASKNPDKVRAIVCLVPVLDIKSWPAGKGTGTGALAQWKQCLGAYEFTEALALAFNGNPLDNFASLAEHRVPVLHFCGDADKVVPYEENSRVLAEKYRKSGGDMQVILVPGNHKVKPDEQHVKAIVDFINNQK